MRKASCELALSKHESRYILRDYPLHDQVLLYLMRLWIPEHGADRFSVEVVATTLLLRLDDVLRWIFYSFCDDLLYLWVFEVLERPDAVEDLTKFLRSLDIIISHDPIPEPIMTEYLLENLQGQ